MIYILKNKGAESMLQRSVIENILTAALAQGADFGEIYVEQTQKNTVSMINSKVGNGTVRRGQGSRYPSVLWKPGNLCLYQ